MSDKMREAFERLLNSHALCVAEQRVFNAGWQAALASQPEQVSAMPVGWLSWVGDKNKIHRGAEYSDYEPLAYESRIKIYAIPPNFEARIVELEKENAHWKSNHADVVKRLAIATQRSDLPIDRIPAMREMDELKTENAALKARLNRNVSLLVNETLSSENEALKARIAELEADALRLNFIANEYLHIEPFAMPTSGGDDADVGWRIFQESCNEDKPRLIVNQFKDDLKSAIDMAFKGGEQCRCQQIGDFCNGEHHPLCSKGGAA